MKRIRNISIGTLASLLIISVGVAVADYDLSWYTFDGGGEMWSAGGGWELSGTIGQPDAGLGMTGGDFELTGGFWAVAIPPPLPGNCDGDNDVDIADFEALAPCLLGPGNGLGPDCDCFDLDKDGSVSLTDFAVFQCHFTGELP